MTAITTGRPGSARLRMGAGGLPARLDWGARSYAVTDRPTRLEDALGHLLTHPLPVRGWRFQATALDDGTTLVVDVLRCDEGWCVVQTYR